MAIWGFLPSLFSPCSSWWKPGHTWHLGHTCGPRAVGSLLDGSAGPSFLSGRPRAAQCPIVPRPLRGASSGRGGPGRKCQLFRVPGEGLDLLAVSIFLRTKVSGPRTGGKSVPLARVSTASTTSSLEGGAWRPCSQPGARQVAAFSSLRAMLGPCSGSGTPEGDALLGTARASARRPSALGSWWGPGPVSLVCTRHLCASVSVQECVSQG